MNNLYIVKYKSSVEYPAHWALMLETDTNRGIGARYHAEGKTDSSLNEIFFYQMQENKRLESQGATGIIPINLLKNITVKELDTIAKKVELPSHATRTNCQDWVIRCLYAIFDKKYIEEKTIIKIKKDKDIYISP
ncbi:hypothetical protein HDU92_007772 [Lobulomyces angularis]|nr:hypothetical protein HDU92_007772 [Lobulomyces angularis]